MLNKTFEERKGQLRLEHAFISSVIDRICYNRKKVKISNKKAQKVATKTSLVIVLFRLNFIQNLAQPKTFLKRKIAKWHVKATCYCELND